MHFLLLLVPFVCLFLSLRSGRKFRLVNDLPTSRANGVFIGDVELKGTAETADPVTSFLAEQACVHYKWSVDEHWSRMVTETYTDEKGHTRTRTRHESGTTTMASGGETPPFYLKDETGVIRIVPDGAAVEPVTIFNQTCGTGDPLYYGKGPSGSCSDSDHRRTFSETAIPVHQPIYVVGHARERTDIVAAEIAQDKNAPIFLISTRKEEQVSRGLRMGFWIWGIVGLVVTSGFGVGVVEAARTKPDMLPLVIAAMAIYPLLWSLGWIWMVYNSLVDLRQRVRQGWSQVDVQLKRRHDLFPSLVAVVTGLRDHERTVQTELAALRTQMTATPPGVAGPDFQGCARTLIALTERYPELKTQESFSRLQKSLVDTENRIALARGYFNEIATFYNTRLEVIPDRFVAALGFFRPQTLMAGGDFDRAPVRIDLKGA